MIGPASSCPPNAGWAGLEPHQPSASRNREGGDDQLMPGTESAVVPDAMRFPSPFKRVRWQRAAGWGFLAGLCLAVLAEAGRVLFGGNLHAVVPGRVYRSGQMSSDKLAQVVRAYDIRTVINLRGCCDP